MKQAIEKIEEKSEIIVISNKYKDILNNLIDSSDTDFPDWLKTPNLPNSLDQLEFIDIKLYNVLKSKSGLPTLKKKDYLDKDVLVTLLELVSKI